MSLLGKAAKYTAKYAARKSLPYVSKKANDKIEEIAAERNQKLFDAQSGTGNLVIRQERHTWKDKLDVFDENQKIKYTVKGELTSIKHHRHIYDANDKELGLIKEKLISLRLPILKESNPVDFIFEIDGHKVGTVKSKWAFGRQNYEVDFNGWRIEGNIFKFEYKIYNGNEVIAQISKKLFFLDDIYVINVPDPNNELVVLMLVISLDAANSSKLEDLKSTFRVKNKWV